MILYMCVYLCIYVYSCVCRYVCISMACEGFFVEKKYIRHMHIVKFV